jgi:hypothetical protein
MVGRVDASAFMPDAFGVGMRLLLDVCAISLLCGALFLRRYSRRDLAAVFGFFNVSLFVVVTVIRFAEVGASVGFGLFAILSIIRLRSEPFRSVEIGYFFGALVLGVLNGVGMPTLWATGAFDALIVVAAYALDHPRVHGAGERIQVTLDVIETDRASLRALLEARLGGRVHEFSVTSVDYIRDAMLVDVTRLPTPAAENVASRPVPPATWQASAASSAPPNGHGVAAASP